MTKSTSRRRSPRHLSDTALVVLGRAADRNDQMLLPIPKSVTARGGALQRVFRGLLDQGLVEEVLVRSQEEAWRSDDEGRYGLRITQAGLKAIGVPALESGLVSGSEQSRARKGTAARPGTKQATLIELLSKPSGQTIEDLTKALSWLRIRCGRPSLGCGRVVISWSGPRTMVARPSTGSRVVERLRREWPAPGRAPDLAPKLGPEAAGALHVRPTRPSVEVITAGLPVLPVDTRPGRSALRWSPPAEPVWSPAML